MELLFVRNVNVTDKNKDMVLKTKLDNDFYLSAHGSHYINLNADELKTYGDFAKILQYVLNELGRSALDDMHIHMGGINYNEKGEKNHLALTESDFYYKECLKTLKDFNVKGCIILEGPLVEKDALLLKNTYKNL